MKNLLLKAYYSINIVEYYHGFLQQIYSIITIKLLILTWI